MAAQPALPYNKTAGYVNQPASRERALIEAADGTANDRQVRVLRYLQKCGTRGATWREAALDLGLHHGQISGTLSVLHGAGSVFALHSKRQRCHVYVANQYRDRFPDADCIDSPAKTRNKRIREEIVTLLEAAVEVQSWTMVVAAISFLNDEA